jgi:hypothetical protein
MYTSCTQVTYLPRLQLPHTCVADSHPASIWQSGASFLPRLEDRLLSVAACHDSANAEADLTARTALAVAHMDVRLEALDVQPPLLAASAPVIAHRFQQSCGAANESLALSPIRANSIELLRCHTTLLAGQTQVQLVACS